MFRSLALFAAGFLTASGIGVVVWNESDAACQRRAWEAITEVRTWADPLMDDQLATSQDRCVDGQPNAIVSWELPRDVHPRDALARFPDTWNQENRRRRSPDGSTTASAIPVTAGTRTFTRVTVFVGLGRWPWSGPPSSTAVGTHVGE